MATVENLINLKDRSPEDALRIRQMGGRACQEVLKRKKLLRDDLITLLETGDTQEKVSLSLIQEALNGNVKAFEVIRDTIGEKPVDRSENKIEYDSGKLDDILKAMK